MAEAIMPAPVSGSSQRRRKPLVSGQPDRGREGAGLDAGRGGVAGIQRARMIAAMVDLARERRAGSVTVAHIVARSGVSRRTFYELFEDREACFLAAFDDGVRQAATRVVPAFAAPVSWCERVRGGLGALLEFLEDEPGLGALCIVDALGMGSAALERRACVVGVLIEAVDEGRLEERRAADTTSLTAEGVVGAVLGVLHARLASTNGGGGRRSPEGSPSMLGLLGPLMGMIVLPYLGAGAAAKELAKPARRHQRTQAPHGDPLRDLDMRLTYRTVQVLLAIAARPGASNRQVADTAGVSDQGQISKLLARLEQLGLIDNRGAGSLRGEPNAWHLTPRGEEIERTIRDQAEPIAR
jgi:AcrR family transcriptional regulator/DNA-binding MarR family transcriptional regulator